MQTQVVPFGKYKGQPLEVLAQDKKYLTWLQGQDWFRQRFANFNTVIVNNFQEAAETPEHNAMQARFTDDAFCHAVTHLLEEKGIISKQIDILDSGGTRIRLDPSNVYFEFERVQFEVDGADLVLYYNTYHQSAFFSCQCLGIELKPTLSDDYPAVLRQMNLNKSTILLIGGYTGQGATIDQVRKIFGCSGKRILLENEIKRQSLLPF